MKNFLLIVFFALIILETKAQYMVIKVIGNVQKKNGQSIKPSTPLKGDSDIMWINSKEKVCAIEIGKGEVVFEPIAQNENGRFVKFITGVLHLDATTGSLSGRGDIIERVPEALQT